MKYILATIPLLLILAMMPTAHAFNMLGGFEDIAKDIGDKIGNSNISILNFYTITAIDLEDVYSPGYSYDITVEVESWQGSYYMTTLIETYNEDTGNWTVLVDDTETISLLGAIVTTYPINIPSDASHILIQVSAEAVAAYVDSPTTEKWLRNVE